MLLHEPSPFSQEKGRFAYGLPCVERYRVLCRGCVMGNGSDERDEEQSEWLKPDFSRYVPQMSDAETTEELISAYVDVFSTEPWNEWKKCAVCGTYWGRRDEAALKAARFMHCETSLAPFWPREEVRRDLEYEITADATCWLAKVSGKVIGFVWGYPIERVALEAKLSITLSFPSIEPLSIAYQDELGVLESYRGQKLARALFELRLKDFLEKGYEYGVVRTRMLPEPSVTYVWFTEKLGYEELARYPGNDGRVVLGAPLARVQKLLSD